MLETHCRKFAESREWVVAVVFTDAGQLSSLEERPGWRAAHEALTSGIARGVVTWTRSMVADSAEAWARSAVLVGDLGCFLVAVALDTPGQSLYGRGVQELAPAGRRPDARRAPGAGIPHPEPAHDRGGP
ncbi:recombinase family protein [Kitasatospora sp. NPDC058218]|uniref:recombinase family protein n=1 Tax=Kitasatospora sp. NPDC058218 TaxID=3346385 RepID=UPI0036D8F3A7